MKIKFKLVDYDTNKMIMCEKKSKFLKNLIEMIDLKQKDLNEDKFCVVACDSDVSGKITIRIITKRGK